MPTLDGKDVKIHVSADCTACGLCVSACPCEYLEMSAGRAAEKKRPPMGCLTCGQCAAICPAGAMTVEAEGIGKEDLVPFSDAKKPSGEELFRLMAGRRSIRQFKDAPVPRDVVERVLQAAQQAPAGLPPSTVKAVCLHGTDKVRAFAFDFLDEAAKMSWLFSSWGVWALRPFMSAALHREMREKIVPIYQGLLAGRRKGEDYLFYNAPFAVILTAEGDSTDAVIAATYAMLAAEAEGLGSCMIGSVVPMLGHAASAFCRRYGLEPGSRHGLAIIFGYPEKTFARGVRRRFAKVVHL